MARHGRPDEWSCPLCTLLNAWRDRRCAACDNERPEALEAAQVAAPETEASPQQQQQQQQQPQQQPRKAFVYRESPGVFFSSAPRSPSTADKWRQEPRLRVNRRRRRDAVAASASAPPSTPFLTAQHQPMEPDTNQVIVPAASIGAAAFGLSTSDDMDEDADVPSFNLLGPGMDLFPVTSETPAPTEQSAMDGLSRVQSSANHFVDLFNSDVQRSEVSTPAYANGFIPASRVVVQEESAVEEKLASAGLNLSDSDEEDGGPNRLRRARRPLTPVWEDESALGTSGPAWECPICTNFNRADLTSCELCDTAKAQENECAVCAKVLSPSATRCNRCGTLRDQDGPGNELIDLASSPEAKRPAVPDRNGVDYDSDFENPYAPAPPEDPDDYPQYLGETRGGYDAVDDISDETFPVQSRPTIRPDLKGFDNFVCVEDLRGDYGCKVNYLSMFTGGRTGKSYADRLVTRRKESQKRKREASKRDDVAAAGGASKPSRQSKPKTSKKGKAPARRRAASTGTKRQRKGGKEDRRSSAPTSTSTVNYYDSNSLDFGDDVRTMAWEGVGSASYY